jgi:hypothetical protein
VWLDHRSGLEPLQAWCAAHPGGRCGVLLGAGLTVPLVVGPELPLADDAALRAYARRVFAHYGQPVEAVATWRSGRWRGAVALDGLDLPALRAVAAQHRVRLAGVWPAWAAALAARQHRGPGLHRGQHRLAWLEPELRTELTLQDGALAGITMHWGEHEAPAAEALAPELARSRVPTAPDFLAPEAAQRPRAGWALAAAGAAVLALAWAESAPESMPPAVAAEATALPHPALRHPWAAVLGAGEAASADELRWLELQHEAGRAELRLRGRADGFGSALEAAGRLASAPEIRSAELARTEAGPAGLDFELLARLAPAQRQP